MSDFRRILIATDFSDHSKRAIDLGVKIAIELNATITLVHACEIPVYAYEGLFFPTTNVVDSLMEAARKELDKTLSSVRQVAPHTDAILRQGTPWQQILAAIEEVRADLIMIGTIGKSGLTRVLVGSVAERIVRFSPVPVLIVR